MSIQGWLWEKLIGLLLSFYPKAWQERFGDQVRADLEEAGADQASGLQMLGWVCASIWDLGCGAVPAHVMAMKKRQVAVMATVGGSSTPSGSGAGGMRALRIALKSLPPWLLWGGLTLVGASLLGLTLYDTGMFWRYGLLGAVLLAVGFEPLHAKVSAIVTDPSDDPVESTARSLIMGIVGLVLAVFYYSLFGLATNLASEAEKVVLPHSMMGVVALPASFIVFLIAAALLFTILGAMAAPSKKPASRVLLAAIMVVAWVGGWFAVQSGAISARSATLFFLPFLLLALSAGNRRKGASMFGLASLLFPLAMFLGFIMGMALDISRSSNDLNKVIGVSASTPTLFDQANRYGSAFGRVQEGAPEHVFWDYLKGAAADRERWESGKVWTGMYDAKPLGVSAHEWCVATSGRYPDRPIEYCATQADREEWLTGPRG